MKKLGKYSFFFGLGGTVYYEIEILFRGFSHWTMFVLAGICFVFIIWQGSITKWQDSILRQMIRCMIFVTSSEFITGIIVNKFLKWNVWDYGSLQFQLLGQISLLFCFLFFLLCTIGIFAGSFLCYRLFCEEKPYYHFL